MGKSKAKLNEDDFSPHLLEAVTQPPAPLPRLILYLLIVLIAGIGVWAFLGKLDIVARADGKLIPQTRLKIVQPLEGGRVSKILVKEGEIVKRDQVLMLMDARLSEADMEKLDHELGTAKLQLLRIDAELTGQPFAPDQSQHEHADIERVREQYETHSGEYQHAIAQQNAALARAKQDFSAEQQMHRKLVETLPIYIQNEKAVKDLGKKGYVSRMDILERERIRIEAERNLQAKQFQIQSLKETINEVQEKINQLKSTYRQQLVNEQIELNDKISQLDQEKLKQQYRKELLELKAPQDGIVKDLATHTEGTVVGAGTVLMNVIPINEPLLAEVFVDNKDVGFIQPGQTARVKLVSYTFQKYGMIDAKVEQVSADTDAQQQPEEANQVSSQSGYRTVVGLEKQYLERDGKKFELRPGMQVTAEIKIGSRTVFEYIVSPVQKTIHEAGTER